MRKYLFLSLMIFILTENLIAKPLITILPEELEGGNAYIVRLEKANALFNYEIISDSITYPLYKISKKTREIVIPLKIEESGEKTITIKKTFLKLYITKKNIILNIKKRNIKTVKINFYDEKMRNSKPQIKEQKEIFLNAINVKTEKRLFHGNFIPPIKGKINSQFAVKRIGKNYIYYHKGVDISAKKGTAVLAANSGNIILSEENLNVYGSIVVIDHGQGIISTYCHLDKILKKTGEAVKKGEIIGEVGKSGWATGPHLHFAIYIQGEAIDPLWWIDFSNNFN